MITASDIAKINLSCFIKTNRVLAVAVSVLMITLLVMSSDERFLAVPAFSCIVLFLWLWMFLWKREGKVPFFDVGMFCALATLVYTIYPLVNYWVDGLQFGLLADARLSSYNISPRELGVFCLRHVLYLFSFVIFYAIFRGREPVGTGNVEAPCSSTSTSIVVYFLLLTGYFAILQLIAGVDFNTSYAPDAYEKYLAAIANLPLLLLQVSEKLWGILFLFKLAVLYILLSRCKQKKWLIILIAWIFVEILHTFILKGSRTGLVFFLLSAGLLYHRMIRPLSMIFLITSGSMAFLFFIFMGMYRAFIDFSSLQVALTQSNAGIFSGGNEFQALLGTAYDVFQLKNSGANLPWYLHINDFITILPPQQILPFEKVPASEWYLREIGASGQGVGFMWGVVAQSIIGFDWYELALRGGVLGYILAKIHNWYSRRQTGFMETLIYVYLCLKIYYTFRDTTFSILANLVWEIIPFYIIIKSTEAFHARFKNALSHKRISASDQSLE